MSTRNTSDGDAWANWFAAPTGDTYEHGYERGKVEAHNLELPVSRVDYQNALNTYVLIRDRYTAAKLASTPTDYQRGYVAGFDATCKELLSQI